MVLLNDNHFIYFLSLVSFLLTETVACCSYYIKELDGKMHEILRQRLSNEAILTPREYLAMSGDFWLLHLGEGDAIDVQWVEVSNTDKYPTMHRKVPTVKNYVSQIVKNAGVEKLCTNGNVRNI